MLRESTAVVRKSQSGECDCGILDEVEEGLGGVVDMPEEEGVEQEGDDQESSGEEEGEGEGHVQQLTMILMSVDAEIKTLYNQILAELDDEARAKLSEELTDLKGVSTDLHEVLSKLSELDPETDKEAIDRLIRR